MTFLTAPVVVTKHLSNISTFNIRKLAMEEGSRNGVCVWGLTACQYFIDFIDHIQFTVAYSN